MKMRIAIASGLTSLIIAATLSACGDLGSEPCTFDADCAVGQVCDTQINECVGTCADNSDCSTGEVCRVREGASSDDRTCQVDNNTTPMGCVDNEDCDAGAVCIAGVCEDTSTPAERYSVIYIEDTTSGAGCTGADPGSDIIFARLTSATGEVLGFARQIDSEVKPEGNDYAAITNFDGEAPANLVNDSDTCTSANPDANAGTLARSGATALGCGGWLLVEFVDDSGTTLDIQVGDRVQVGEFGTQCLNRQGSPAGNADDTYSVFLCTDTTAAADGNNASCTELLTDNASGYSDVAIASFPN